MPATALPAAVRTGSDDDKKAYKAALGFEQVLLGQLVKEMLPKDSDAHRGPVRRADAGRLRPAPDRRRRHRPRRPALPGDAKGPVVSTVLEAELLVHLDTQINSARRLLELVLAQGTAIRARDVDAVLARLADIQTEMGRRGALEQDRAGAAPARRRRARRRPPPRSRSSASARSSPPAPPSRRASAPPSCAACSPRSPASTASTAR